MPTVNGGSTEPTVLQCCIEFWHGAFPSVEGSRVVLYVPGLQHAPCLSVGVRIYDRRLARDPTAALECKMNSVLLNLRRASRLPGNMYHHLHSSAGQVPRLYGSPKVHNQDVPLRPIVSFVSSPTFQLSKFLSTLLSPIVGLSDHHVRNLQHFAQFVTTQKLRHRSPCVIGCGFPLHLSSDHSGHSDDS